MPELTNPLPSATTVNHHLAKLYSYDVAWTLRYAEDRLHFRDATLRDGTARLFDCIEHCCDFLYDQMLDAEELDRLKIKHCKYDGTCDIELDGELIAYAEKVLL